MKIKKNRTEISIQKKQEILKYKDANIGVSQRSLAIHFGLSLGAINAIFQNAESIMNNPNSDSKRTRSLYKTEKIDQSLYLWFQSKRSRNCVITGDMMKCMAMKMAEKVGLGDFSASTGWLIKFQKRHGIISKSISGESGLIDESKIYNFKDFFANKLNEYEEKDIFNCDESGLFFKCSNSNTLAFSYEDRISGKFSKERVTVQFCCSMTGEKIQPLIIGKSKAPRSLKNIDLSRLGVVYKNNSKSWMTLEIFNWWINELNTKMITENRKILLILDNAPVHPCDSTFSNVEMLYLPPNCTSRIQPLDQGIIKSFKDQYKRLINRFVLMEMENENIGYQLILKKIDMQHCVMFSAMAWRNVTMECIKNCFKKALENAKIYQNTTNLESSCECNSDEKVEFDSFDPLIKDDDYYMDQLCIDSEDVIGHDIADDSDESEKHEMRTPNNAEAYQLIKSLELWYLKNKPENIQRIYDCLDDLNEDKKDRKLKITDFFIRK